MTKSQTDAMRQRWEAVMMNNYGTPAVALASGDGAVVTDVDGRSYLDLLGGIAVNVLGHRHPAIIEAVTHQMTTLATRPISMRPNPASLWPKNSWPCWAPTNKPGCSSATRAPRPTNSRSSCRGSPAARNWLPHKKDSTAGRWARWR